MYNFLNFILRVSQILEGPSLALPKRSKPQMPVFQVIGVLVSQVNLYLILMPQPVLEIMLENCKIANSIIYMTTWIEINQKIY